MVLYSLFSNGFSYIIYLTEILHRAIICLLLFGVEQANQGELTIKTVRKSRFLMEMRLI